MTCEDCCLGEVHIFPGARGKGRLFDVCRLASLAWSAVACFIVEYAGLFSGLSVFYTALNCFYTLVHFVGTILVGLFVGEVGLLCV